MLLDSWKECSPRKALRLNSVRYNYALATFTSIFYLSTQGNPTLNTMQDAKEYKDFRTCGGRVHGVCYRTGGKEYKTNQAWDTNELTWKVNLDLQLLAVELIVKQHVKL